MTPPKISVCIPSYNYASYLGKAVDSVLAQTYQDFEIVLVDDGSTDESLNIAKTYESRYPTKIHVFSHEGDINRGISATCNLAVRESHGEYLAWLGSDDIWYPEKLQTQIDYFYDHPEIQLVYSYAEVIDNNGEITGEKIGKDITVNPIPMLLSGNYLPALTVMHASKCHDELGYYDEQLLYSDWHMWLRIASHHPIGFIDRSLGQYRVHGKNAFAGKDREDQLINDIAVLKMILTQVEKIGGSICQPRFQALAAIRLSSLLFILGENREYKHYIEKAYSIYPELFRNIHMLVRWLESIRARTEFYPVVQSVITLNNEKNQKKLLGIYYFTKANDFRITDRKLSRYYAFKGIASDINCLFTRQMIKLLIGLLFGNEVTIRIKSILRKYVWIKNGK